MNLRPLLSHLYEFLIYGKEKAVVAFLVAGGATFAAQHLGYHLSSGSQQLLITTGIGLLSHLGVYLTQNRG